MTTYPEQVAAAAAQAAGVRPGPRLPGLDRRNLGPVQVFAQSVSATAPAAAMATAPAMAALNAGPGVVWSFVAATVIALLIGSCVGQFTRRMAAAGSLYSLASKGLGPAAGFACGGALLVGYGLLVSAALTGCAVHLLKLLARIGAPVASGAAVAVVIVVLGLAAAFFAVRGIRLSARVVLLVEGASITLILAVFGLLLGHGVSWPAAPHRTEPGGGGIGGVAAGVLPALGAFIGFESAAALGVEARRPFRTVPRAVRWTAGAAGAMFICAAAVQVLGFAAVPEGLAGQTDPLGVLASAQQLPWISPLLDAGIATSFFACALATANALVRVLFSMGTEGIAPSGLRRTHRTYRTPYVAIAMALPVTTAVPLTVLATGTRAERVLDLLLQASTVGYLVAYLLVCLAVPFFLRGIGESTPGPVAAVVVVVPVLVAALWAFAGSAAGSSYAVVFAVLTGAGLLWYGWLRRRHPSRLAGIGVYDETSFADLLGGGPDLAPDRRR
ncbi:MULTISPECIES: APC family permease [unclassified Streptomyces]|uniref:APC family permease n=1 Tax=unclassified Streptomyces TaxID=2593676 RepID=UPI00099B71EB|nr:APC family permease [Streptomyces sp. NRRL WC-3618]